MSVTFTSIGAFTSASSSVTLAYPSAPSAGVIAVAVVDSGHPTVGTTPTASPGWALIGSFAGGGGVYGDDAGPRRSTLFIRQLQGGDDPPTFTIPANTNCRVGGAIVYLGMAASSVLRYLASFGEDTTSGTGFSAAGAATIPFAVNDLVLLAYVVAIGTATYSAEAITAAGITFGAVTERGDSVSTVGANASRAVATASVTVGTATVAPTVTATLSVASTGVGATLRLRDAAVDAGPATLTLTYDTTLSRIKIDAAGLDANATLATIERSKDQVTWTAVRGGVDVTISAGAVTVYDYEFVAGVLNYYRVTAYNAGLVITDRELASITPVLDRIWVKSIIRPFLNRAVTVVGWSDITRAARSGDFDVVGRSFPVAVTDVRGSRAYDLQLYAATAQDAQTLDFILASGDVLFVHTPAGCPVPGGYVRVGDTSQRRPHVRAVTGVFTLPVVEVAAPGPDVVGAVSTWATVLASYATWSDLLAANATWADLLARIAPPSEVIVA
jgi:hypothetical protein